jgi:hypothetical protein
MACGGGVLQTSSEWQQKFKLKTDYRCVDYPRECLIENTNIETYVFYSGTLLV